MAGGKGSGRPRVGLFATCLVDLFRPETGFAAARLIEAAGCDVDVPESQTCCGQPAYNSGDREDAKAIARQVVETFEGFDYVVVPSGSCAATLSRHYPELLADDPAFARRAEALAAKTFELTAFLYDVMGITKVKARFAGSVTYHDACSGLRELSIQKQPRELLQSVEGLTLTEMTDPDVCCGFGGTFCVKYPEISNAIVTKKAATIAASGAETLVAGDLGCLMNMAGKLSRDGRKVRARHVAEVLADMGEGPAIGEAK
ncbi:Fe-S oxidoreductase [Afifella sp. IM 167]|nr:Fe-S oxidoreductase [Afifella sp. IM 167]